MTIDDLGALGDFIGGFAVIAGLFFVGLQLLAANREARAAANRLYADSIIDMGRLIYESTEMADIWVRGLAGLDDLEINERVRFMGLIGTNMLKRWENLHSLKASNRLDESVWDSAEQMLGPLLNSKGFAEVWFQRKHWYRPSFQSYIDSLMAKGTGPSLLESYGKSHEAHSDT